MSNKEITRRIHEIYSEVGHLLNGREERVTNVTEATEEKLAVMAVFGGIVISTGRDMPRDAVAFAQRMAVDIANQIRPPQRDTGLVSADGNPITVGAN